jgi:gamma-glutamyltranspeptidase/glutathione hydrolase
MLLLTTTILDAQDRLSGKTFATRSEVIAKNGMAATNHPLATQIAIDILKKGGSAVDAAIAANAFLGFADPAMNGIGGDLFAIIWNADDEKLYALNASGRSPAKLNLQYFKDHNLTSIPGASPLAITVPGCVDGWYEMHQKFGRMPMADLLVPTINYAREGIPVAQEIADMMQYLDRSLLKAYTPEGNLTWEDLPDFNQVYRREGRFPVKGEMFKNESLANTLQSISDQGRDAFYNGSISRSIVKHVQGLGGYLSEDDFSNHKSEWVDPVSTNYRGYEIWEIPPNGQGVSVLQMLNILEGYNIREFGFGSKEHIHYFTEAKKLAYADLSQYYADPDFNDIPLSALMSKEYAKKRRNLIDHRQSKNYGPGLEEDAHTIYLTVADKDGNMVSLIQSNSWLFGSLIVSPKLGFCLQNRGTGFKLEEGHLNTYAPRKRPFHTIIPAFITKEKQPYVSFGLVGGGMQPQGHVQIVMNLIDFNMNLQEAGDAPRIRHEYIYGPASDSNTGSIRLESGYSYETIRKLIKMGHDVSFGFERYGGYQAILYDGNVYYGASESRKDGQAAGY